MGFTGACTRGGAYAGYALCLAPPCVILHGIRRIRQKGCYCAMYNRAGAGKVLPVCCCICCRRHGQPCYQVMRTEQALAECDCSAASAGKSRHAPKAVRYMQALPVALPVWLCERDDGMLCHHLIRHVRVANSVLALVHMPRGGVVPYVRYRCVQVYSAGVRTRCPYRCFYDAARERPHLRFCGPCWARRFRAVRYRPAHACSR